MGQKWTFLVINKNLSLFSNFQITLLMWWSHCHFPCVKQVGELIFIGEISTSFLCGPRCFRLLHCLNFWFLFVHCSSSNIFFNIVKSLFEGRGETVKFVRGPRICGLLVRWGETNFILTAATFHRTYICWTGDYWISAWDRSTADTRATCLSNQTSQDVFWSLRIIRRPYLELVIF